MTTQYVRTALGTAGLSGLVCKLIDTTNTDTVSYTSDSVSAATNAVGTYVFTFGESAVIPQQWWRIVVVDGSGNLRGDGFGYFLGTDGELVEGVSQPVRSSVPTTTTPTVERSVADTKAIAFAWPVSGATITGQRSTNQGSYTSLTGAISYLRQDGDVYWYSLAYNAADRDTAENNIRYKFTDGTYTRWLNLRLTQAPLTTLGTNAPAGWINAAAIASSALDGKGNWNVGKTGYSLTAGTGLGNQTANITGNLSGSVGSVTAGVTVDTNNDKTGYSLSQSFPTHFANMQIAANGHVSAVVESMANNSITASAIQGDAITAAKIAADAVAEIQSGLATATELAKVPKQGETRRYTQVAADSNNKTADVSIGAAL